MLITARLEKTFGKRFQSKKLLISDLTPSSIDYLNIFNSYFVATANILVGNSFNITSLPLEKNKTAIQTQV